MHGGGARPLEREKNVHHEIEAGAVLLSPQAAQRPLEGLDPVGPQLESQGGAEDEPAGAAQQDAHEEEVVLPDPEDVAGTFAAAPHPPGDT